MTKANNRIRKLTTNLFYLCCVCIVGGCTSFGDDLKDPAPKGDIVSKYVDMETFSTEAAVNRMITMFEIQTLQIFMLSSGSVKTEFTTTNESLAKLPEYVFRSLVNSNVMDVVRVDGEYQHILKSLIITEAGFSIWYLELMDKSNKTVWSYQVKLK